MRDEVPRPREEDKTGVSENRFYQYRPQPQPRLRFHPSSPPSSSDDQSPEESVLSPLTSHTPVKKTNNGGVKCAKMVSFKEPEPWRDVTPPPPPPSSSLPSSLSSTPSQNEKELSSDGQESKQVRTVTQPQTSSVRRPSSEPILSGGSTAALSSGTHRHIQATREKSSTPPPRLSPPSSSSSSSEPLSTRTSRHRRNMSMPTQSTTMSSATASNVPQRMQAGQGAMVEEPRAKSSSGNRLIRLWRSATQKYSSHHHHQHSNGVGLLAGKGSDLEPLVSMARE
ncbi:hypothetical protein BGX23_008158 [Mortierella sp. AD031]|nr:hypothetical protein BGX23_008158 [Mortierella sp. AD031]